MTLQTLRILRAILWDRQICVGGDDGEIQAVLAAKAELAQAIAQMEAAQSDNTGEVAEDVPT